MSVRVYNQVELAFWDFIVFALSRSRIIRRIAQLGYRLFSTQDFRVTLKKSLFVGMSGFCFGIGLFFLATLIG